MADWTTIPDSSIEPGKPIRSIDGLALRDNPIAIAEGAAGAPRIVGRAAKRLIDYPVLTTTASSSFSASNGVNTTLGTNTTGSTSNVTAWSVTVLLYTGSLRFAFTQSATNSNVFGVSSIVSVFKNNVFVQSFSLNVLAESSGSAQRVVDISIDPNDIIEVRHRVDSTNATSTVNLPNVLGSDVYQVRSLFIAQSEVNNP